MLKATALSKIFKRKHWTVKALDNATLEIKEGEFVVLLILNKLYNNCMFYEIFWNTKNAKKIEQHIGKAVKHSVQSVSFPAIPCRRFMKRYFCV
jgi:hypothetical protein